MLSIRPSGHCTRTTHQSVCVSMLADSSGRFPRVRSPTLCIWIASPGNWLNGPWLQNTKWPLNLLTIFPRWPAPKKGPWSISTERAVGRIGSTSATLAFCLQLLLSTPEEFEEPFKVDDLLPVAYCLFVKDGGRRGNKAAFHVGINILPSVNGGQRTDLALAAFRPINL